MYIYFGLFIPKEDLRLCKVLLHLGKVLHALDKVLVQK